MTGIEKEVRDARNGILRRHLSLCTKEQVELFNRMYGSVEQVTEDKFPHACRQIERTIELNKEISNASS